MAFTKITHAGIGSTGTVLLENLQVIGVGTFGTLSVGGAVSVGGTLTYEDVTNIDSVGLITARNGIKVDSGTVTVGSGVTISPDNIFTTGIVTASSFSGDGTGLTGVAGTENIRTNTNATFLQNINVGVAITAGKLGIGFTDANVKVGNTALDSLTTGDNNTAVGNNALTALTTGTNNTAVGRLTLDSATTADNNTAVGALSLESTTTGGDNTAVGVSALRQNTASNNTAVGRAA